MCPAGKTTLEPNVPLLIFTVPLDSLNTAFPAESVMVFPLLLIFNADAVTLDRVTVPAPSTPVCVAITLPPTFTFPAITLS